MKGTYFDIMLKREIVMEPRKNERDQQKEDDIISSIWLTMSSTAWNAKNEVVNLCWRASGPSRISTSLTLDAIDAVSCDAVTRGGCCWEESKQKASCHKQILF